jgi:tetratricopeptide (TPR) repeat protein
MFNRRAVLLWLSRKRVSPILASLLTPYLSVGLALAQSSGWWLAEDKNFQVYSHVSSENARSVLQRFERLRVFWTDGAIPGLGGLLGNTGAPLRVLEFNSAREYGEFRTHQAADAYYIGSDAGEYIVLPPSASLGISAHEYAHAILHARGLQLPDWLGEGLAEVFSTVRPTDSGFEFGGEFPSRLDTLRRRTRIPVSELLSPTRSVQVRDSREAAALFYGESWALADMLVSSPQYGRLDQLFGAIRAGKSGKEAFEVVYGKSLLALTKDLADWIARGTWPRHFVPAQSVTAATNAPVPLTDLKAGMLLADLLVVNGEWSRAEGKYKELLREYPGDANLLTSLEMVAFRAGREGAALQDWRKAIDSGANDPGLCYRFAVLAEAARLPEDEIAHALERAIAAKPDFSDARYRLAILESNRGNHAAAVQQLKAMGIPSGSRAYSYWSALASSLSELGRTEEATAAAHQAILSAKTPDERGIAAALEYTTKTDFHVQFEPGKDGQMKAVTIRTDGQLRNVQCSEGKLVGFSVDTKAGSVQLEISDPARVLMRNSPPEFSCGPQQPVAVKVEYAKSTAQHGALLRGMEFR